jgi:hypothetical protein
MTRTRLATRNRRRSSWTNSAGDPPSSHRGRMSTSTAPAASASTASSPLADPAAVVCNTIGVGWPAIISSIAPNVAPRGRCRSSTTKTRIASVAGSQDRPAIGARAPAGHGHGRFSPDGSAVPLPISTAPAVA